MTRPSSTKPPGWTFAIVVDRPVHGHAGQPRRRHRAADDPRRPRRVARVPRVDGQRVHLAFAVLLLTGAALGDRFGGAGCSSSASALFTVASAPRRAGPDDRRAGRRPRAQGLGAAIVAAAHADAALRGGPRETARPGARHLVGGQRPRRGPRPGRRRRGRRRHLLALDLLAQRPDRPGAAPARRAAC